MSAPSQPTTTNQATEAWKLFGKRTPTTAEITRAVDYGLEMVKSDLKEMGLEWSFLRRVSYRTLTAFDSKIQLPTDFAKGLSVQILKGSDTGTAQAGAAATITLAADDSHTTDEVEGHWIGIYGGTGSNQVLQCKDFNTTTKVATVTESWATNPDSTSTYVLIDSFEDCKYKDVYHLDEIRLPQLKQRPTIAYHVADDAEGDLHFNYAPDDDFTYIAKIRYYADILKEDITGDRYNRMLYLLNGLFIQGMFVWALQNDTRQPLEFQKYQNKLNKTAALYLYPNQIPDSGSILDYQ